MEPLPVIRPTLHIKCEECAEPLYLLADSTQASIVEWLGDNEGLCIASSIRAVHTCCRYARVDRDRLDASDLYDYWLPLYELDLYYDLVEDRDWDDYALMTETFNNLTQEANK